MAFLFDFDEQLNKHNGKYRDNKRVPLFFLPIFVFFKRHTQKILIMKGFSTTYSYML